MNNDKRVLLQASALAGLVLIRVPARWGPGVITSLSLPVHAMTSNAPTTCTSFSEEAVDEPIEITVTTTEVIGPIIAIRSDNNFNNESANTSGTCADGSEQISTVIFRGTINPLTEMISGDFNVVQSCGGAVQCEQIAEFSATKVSGASGVAEGNYQGRVVGTLRCCEDLV